MHNFGASAECKVTVALTDVIVMSMRLIMCWGTSTASSVDSLLPLSQRWQWELSKGNRKADDKGWS